MDRWFTSVDAYCERTGPDFWAEPVNALTNIAFLLAAGLAFAAWRRQGRRGRRGSLVLSLIVLTVLIGLGSFAFHTFATPLAALADTLPIAVFIYLYLFLALRRILHLGFWPALLVLAGFIALSHGLPRLMPGHLPGGLAHYLPALCAMLTIGLLARGKPAGKQLLLTAGVFSTSLTFRTIDLTVCDAFPLGTHFVWHALNAVVLYLLLRTAIRETAEA